MRKAFALLIVLLAIPALSGCTSIEDYLDKQGVVKVYITTGPGELDDFRTVDLVVRAFVVKDTTAASRAPEYFNLSTKVDLANIRSPYQVHEMKLPVGSFNITAMTVSVTGAVLKNGTSVPVAVRDTHGPGVYAPKAAGGKLDLASFDVARAKESFVKVAFTVKLNTAPQFGPNGAYYLDWVDSASGSFVPS